MVNRLSIHQLYKEATERPGDPHAASQLALAYSKIGPSLEALIWIQKAVELSPLLGDYLYIKGKVLSQLEKFDEAGECYERAIKLGTRMPNPSAFLAKIYARMPERRAETFSLLRGAVQHNPENAFPYTIMADCFGDQTLAGIVASSRSILTGAYNKSALYCAIAESLCRRGRFQEAAASSDFAIQDDPKCSYAWFVRGSIALHGFHDPIGALHCHTQAAILDESWVEAVIGDLLYLGQYENARERFLSTRPDYRLFLSQPDPDLTASPLSPVFDGKTILARATMGFGDAILHTRFASLASEKGARVLIQCPKAICSLLKTAPGVANAIAHEESPGVVDFEMNLEYLGFLFPLSLEQTGLHVPCISPRLGLSENWHSRLPPPEVLRVGISWRGGPTWQDEPHRSRSIPLVSFASLFQIPGTTWVSLQKGPGHKELRAHAGVHPILEIGLGGDDTDFADAAAVIASLDLVISVDTSIAHLAGSIGKPTFVLLPYTAFWIWSLKGERTAWYPATKLFRQSTPGEWTSPIEQVKAQVESLVGERSGLSNFSNESGRPSFSLPIPNTGITA